MMNEPTSDQENIQFHKAVADFRDNTLAALPNPFEQLVYLSSLRNLATDEYGHWGMESMYGVDVLNQALREIHRGVFREVSSCPLERLHLQIVKYLEGLEDHGRALLKNWKVGLIYNFLFPPDPDPLDLESFRINMDAILEIITRKTRHDPR